MDEHPASSRPDSPRHKGHSFRNPSWRDQYSRHPRPPWWPENEDWPPRSPREWRRIGRHNPFFRRLGCLFAAISVLGVTVFVSILGFVLSVLNLVHPSIGQSEWLLPVSAVVVGLVVVILVTAGTNLRRMSVPLDDLLSASRQVADGNYSVRVEEKGPPEIRSLARAFNSMAERLQINDRQRRSMLADVSHELRTPLTIIRGNVEGILDGMYPAGEAQLKTVLEETQVLSRLVDDLRTLVLAESGSLELKREPTDLNHLVQETVKAFQSQADSAGVEIEIGLSDGLPLLDLDPERIRQVLTNLVSNALRYTRRAGKVRIRLSPEPGTGRDQVARVEVADDGPGIDPGELPHVFDRFYKSGDSHGMGLGLSIAKTLVEAHGGQIEARSEPGKGTTISFSLPYS